MDGQPVLEVDLPPTVDAPSLARTFVLGLMDRMSPQLRDDAGLVVSELVTTALTYPRDPLPMRLRVDLGEPLTMTVEHLQLPARRTAPIPSTPTPWSRELVASIARAWGVTARDGRMSTWAELHAVS